MGNICFPSPDRHLYSHFNRPSDLVVELDIVRWEQACLAFILAVPPVFIRECLDALVLILGGAVGETLTTLVIVAFSGNDSSLSSPAS